MRVNGLFAWRPRKDRKSPILRSHKRNRVALVVDKLRGGQMPRAARAAPRSTSVGAPPSTGSVTITDSTGAAPRRR